MLLLSEMSKLKLVLVYGTVSQLEEILHRLALERTLLFRIESVLPVTSSNKVIKFTLETMFMLDQMLLLMHAL